MPLEVAQDTLGRLRAQRDQGLLRIVQAEDHDLAAAVLRGLEDVLVSLGVRDDVGWVDDEVMETPAGPMILVEMGEVPSAADVARILDALVVRADQLGLRSGVLEVPRTGKLINQRDVVRRAVVGSVLPSPNPTTGRSPARLPAGWVAVAESWLREAGHEPPVVTVEAAIPWSRLREFLRRNANREFWVSCGSFETGIRTVVRCAHPYTRLAFMACGASFSPDDYESEAEQMRAHVRRCVTDAAYAYIAPVSSISFFGIGEHDVPVRLDDGRPGARCRCLRHLPDIAALDAFWWQLLGPGHVRRIGELPGAEPIGHGKIELTLGSFGDWLDADRAAPVRDRGRELLAPCFLSREEARAVLRSRAPKPRPPTGS